MVLLPFKTEYVRTPRSPAEVRDDLAERTGPYPAPFRTTEAVFINPGDRNTFVLERPRDWRGMVAVAEGTIRELPQGGGSMVRIDYRLSWVSFVIWVAIIEPLCAANAMLIPDALKTGGPSQVVMHVFTSVMMYGGLGILPFRYQQRRLAASIKAAILPEGTTIPGS